jgi:hypothetical protein
VRQQLPRFLTEREFQVLEPALGNLLSAAERQALRREFLAAPNKRR